MTAKKTSPKILLRLMESRDVGLRNYWANDAQLNKFIQMRQPVSAESTAAWFRERSAEENTRLLIIEAVKEKVPVGFARAAINYDEAEIHIIIGVEHQGKGYGTAAINAMVKWLFSMPRIKKIFVRVQKKNTAALKLFRKCGFAETGETVLRVEGAGRAKV